MALVLTEEQNFTDIANSIRKIINSDITMKPSEMSSEIDLGKKCFSFIIERHGSSIVDLRLPKEISVIGRGAFYHFSGLAGILLPDSITEIRTATFTYCDHLRSIVIPENVRKITLGEEGAFKGCNDLKCVFFKGTPDSIGTYTFSLCGSLSYIFVPWSPGDVAGAPWGAANSNIIYYNKTIADKFKFNYGDEVFVEEYECPYGSTWRDIISNNVVPAKLALRPDGISEYVVANDPNSTKVECSDYSTIYADQLVIPGTTYFYRG